MNPKRLTAANHKALVGALSTLAASGAIGRLRAAQPPRQFPTTRRTLPADTTSVAASVDAAVSNPSNEPIAI
jgi:hypothetical protein